MTSPARPRLAVLSFFRNAARSGQVRRFMRQCNALALAAGSTSSLPLDVTVLAVWGDSHDGTEDALVTEADACGISVRVIEASHGGPSFGSTEHLDRMVTMSWLGNKGLDAVDHSFDYVWYVESDLIWRPSVPLGLLHTLINRSPSRRPFDVLAPLVFAGAAFYDIFAFRKGTNPDGTDRRFSPFHPFHPDLSFEGPTEVDSVGSALMMRAEVAHVARMNADPDAKRHCLISFCFNARALGYVVGTDARYRIEHPA